MSPKILLDEKLLNLVLERLACELIEFYGNFTNTIFIGLQPRGVFVLDRVLKILEQQYNFANIESGKLDTTFFRDDFRRTSTPHLPSKTLLNNSVEGKSVLLMDDVLFTGRSVRAALTAIEHFGRPKDIRLLCLIDRRFSRELPIQPDFIGRKVDALLQDKIRMNWKENDGNDLIYLDTE